MKMSIEDGLTYRHKSYANNMKANPNWEEQQRKSEEYAKKWMESSARAYKIAQEKLAKLEKEVNEN
jgi:hypothetical protein